MRVTRAAVAVAVALAVTAGAAGCRADRPTADVPPAAPATAADPFADVDAALDAVEQDLDGAAADG
ncbi:hypothetical protein BJF78_15825 [Pseudonocardia sp. CNS-139]|nr:hypothetical protein BJF78_15825 [Pseudonocardia sp. CNS-139]